MVKERIRNSQILCRFEQNTKTLKWLFTLLLLTVCVLTKSQSVIDTSAIEISSITDTIKITSKALVLIDSSANLKPEDAVQKKFMPLEFFIYKKSVSADMSVYRYYLKFSAINKSEKTTTVYLYPGVLYNKVTTFKNKRKAGRN